jgi:outer membrane protein X
MMKKSLLIIVTCLGVALSVHAQEGFSPFRIDIGMGYAKPINTDLKGGLMAYIEPKYEIVPRFSVGVRWEVDKFAVAGKDASIKLSSSSMVTGDYFLSNSRFRPFIGVGCGAYIRGGITVNGDLEKGETRFGALARTGFDLSHIRVTVSYNRTFTKDPFQYVAASIGLYIGGGKR